MEIPARMSAASVGAVKANDVEILVLNPDSSEKASLARLRIRRDVKHQAAHFAQEFTSYIIKLVVLLIESIRVDENHLQEAVRQILHREREEVSDPGKYLFPFCVRVRQRDQAYAL